MCLLWLSRWLYLLLCFMGSPNLGAGQGKGAEVLRRGLVESDSLPES